MSSSRERDRLRVQVRIRVPYFHLESFKRPWTVPLVLLSFHLEFLDGHMMTVIGRHRGWGPTALDRRTFNNIE